MQGRTSLSRLKEKEADRNGLQAIARTARSDFTFSLSLFIDSFSRAEEESVSLAAKKEFVLGSRN